MDKILKLTIKTMMDGGQCFELEISSSSTIRDLKAAIFLKTHISPSEQVLIHRKSQLRLDDQSFESIGINENSVITMNTVISTGLTNSSNKVSDQVLENIAQLLSTDGRSTLAIMDAKASRKKQKKKKNKISDELQAENQLIKSRMIDVQNRRKLNKRHLNSQIPSTNSISLPSSLSSSSSNISIRSTSINSSDISLNSDSNANFNSSDNSNSASTSSVREECKDSSAEGSIELEKWKCQLKNCGRKLSLTEQSMTCRCEKSFCFKHRGPETHLCPIDYKQIEREKLRKENPKVDSRTCGKHLNS